MGEDTVGCCLTFKKVDARERDKKEKCQLNIGVTLRGSNARQGNVDVRAFTAWCKGRAKLDKSDDTLNRSDDSLTLGTFLRHGLEVVQWYLRNLHKRPGTLGRDV